jgi:hypothetical protein
LSWVGFIVDDLASRCYARGWIEIQDDIPEEIWGVDGNPFIVQTRKESILPHWEESQKQELSPRVEDHDVTQETWFLDPGTRDIVYRDQVFRKGVGIVGK